jgi:hypothetical protein
MVSPTAIAESDTGGKGIQPTALSPVSQKIIAEEYAAGATPAELATKYASSPGVAASIDTFVKSLPPQGTKSGTQTAETKQAETQGQTATSTPVGNPVTPARGTSARPDLSAELPAVNAKLGQRGAKLDEQSKDAKAYFGKVTPELALDAIANDLVYQPTAYRNSKMKAFAKSPQGPEPLFADKAEAAFFQGQGGIHAKNAEKWARANLSPEAVTFLDQKIAQYKKEKQKSLRASLLTGSLRTNDLISTAFPWSHHRGDATMRKAVGIGLLLNQDPYGVSVRQVWCLHRC